MSANPSDQTVAQQPDQPAEPPEAPGTTKQSRKERERRIGLSPRWDGRQFRNTHPVTLSVNPLDLRMAADFAFGSAKRSPTGPLPLFAQTRQLLQGPPQDGLRLTWLGHSVVLIEIDGIRLLTDPVWGMRASPVAFAGPKRFHPMPLQLGELGRIDAILLSHDHYDHLCAPTWRQLAAGAAPGWSGRVITSLGVGAHLEKLGIRPEQIAELDWGEGTTVTAAQAKVEVIATPSQHFSGRGATDRNRTLWSGFAIQGPKHKVFFSGDTGQTDEHADIGRSLGPFDVVLLEIGAWHPAWGSIHLGPERALQTFASMGARSLLPVHWATFDLGLHHWAEPAETLWQLARAQGAAVHLPPIGGSISAHPVAGQIPWWQPTAASRAG